MTETQLEAKLPMFKDPVVRTSTGDAPLLVIHGAPGVGKSTWAASAPNPLFLFTENGQRDLAVRTLKDGPIETYEEFMMALIHIFRGIKNKTPGFADVQTLVVDTIDHLETLVTESVVEHYRSIANNPAIISMADIPNIYNFDKWDVLKSKWNRLATALTTIKSLGIPIIGLAHSVIRTVENPAIDSTYESHEIKLSKQAISCWIDNADAIGYLHYDIVTDADKKKTLVPSPFLSFKRSHAYLSKPNYGLDKYKLSEPTNGFMLSVGCKIPYFKQFEKKA